MNLNDNNSEFNYINEKIKERPINKRKLLKRTIMTAFMAVIFGIIACVTLLVLEPVFNNWLYPEPEPDPVVITGEEEILPENMVVEEVNVNVGENIEEQLEQDMEIGLEEYQLFYQSIREVVTNFSKSLVTVTAVSQDVDWFNNIIKNEGSASGVIIADNGVEILILVDTDIVKQVDNIQVTFFDDTVYEAQMKQSDSNLGIGILSVSKNILETTTKEGISTATLGSSKTNNLIGSPIIALGNPLGNKSSAIYGMITSADTTIQLMDKNIKLITTDIYGSVDATGFILDMAGRVLGIIKQNYNGEDTKNLISAYGITELKRSIERMSNDQEIGYVGITAMDVPENITETLEVPKGAYVTSVLMGTPAMQAGIQSGDVIVGMDDTEITSFNEYVLFLNVTSPNQEVKVKIMRQSQNEYREMEVVVTTSNIE